MYDCTPRETNLIHDSIPRETNLVMSLSRHVNSIIHVSLDEH